MSKASSLPYRLRPNKAVDRELFLGLLARLGATLNIERYSYIGLGGPFLEDFRLVHARLGVTRMVCIEVEESVHKRQLFNRPVDCIDCLHSTMEDYVDGHEFDGPTIMWLDYTDPGQVTDQIERFARTPGQVPVGSIIRVTLNANPASLGKPDPAEIAAEVGIFTSPERKKPTMQEWRLARFRERLGRLFPSDLKPDGMTFRNFGRSILRVLRLAVEKEELSLPDRKVVWALATHYADGQPMVTATLVVCSSDDHETPAVVQGWEFHSTPDDPHLLDMPALSTLERLTLEATADAMDRLDFDLPKSDMGEDPYESFRKFYRIYPHFSRVEI